MKGTPENRKKLKAEILRQRTKTHNELNELFFKVTGNKQFKKNIRRPE